MLSIIIAIAIWGILGLTYTFVKRLDRFDIPISIWTVIGIFLIFCVGAKGIGVF